MQKSQNI